MAVMAGMLLSSILIEEVTLQSIWFRIVGVVVILYCLSLIYLWASKQAKR